MDSTISIKSHLFVFGVPLLLITALIVLAKSNLFALNPDSLSFGITTDLLLTVPLAYFLLIRKKDIPKITVIPWFIGGIVIASLILPKENQFFLGLAKTWILPIVEITIILMIVGKVRKASKYFKETSNPGFFTTLKGACAEVLPKQVVIPFAFEIGVFYYAFLDWKKYNTKQNEFTYHKDTGTVALLATLLFLVIFETFAIHLLLAKWSLTAAWILTGLSIFSGYQILGFLKSMSKRPIVITNEHLILRCGMLSEATIPLDDIEKIELSSRSLNLDQETNFLSPLGKIEGHNCIITLRKENVTSGFYGMKKKFSSLAFHVDQKEEFKAQVEANILRL